MELLKRINPLAKGNKTYAVGLLTLVYVAIGYFVLGQGLNEELLVIALTALGIRNAIK